MTIKNSDLRVLLTAAGGIHTLGVIDCLRNNYEKRKIKIICTDIIEQPLLRYKADGFYVVPKGNSKNYIITIKQICKKEKINVIIPGNGYEILSISNNIELFNSQKISSTVPNYEAVKITMDKEKTFSKLNEIGVKTPDYYKVKNYDEFLTSLKKLGYPKNDVCFKPSRYSQSGGTRGFRILRKKNTSRKIILESKPDSVEIDFETTKNMLQAKGDLDLLVMEYLPGDEFSTYVFADKGKMIYCITNLRQKLNRYYSFEAEIISNKKIEKMCKKIVDVLKLDYNVNIQFKNSKNGQAKLIEVNPRIGGTIVLPAVSGINLPYFAVKQSLGEKIPLKKQIKKTKMIRYWKELYIQGSKNFEINSNMRI